MAYEIPDFSSLAQQQAGLNTNAARAGTWANRADQTNSMGSMTWNQDPSGRWIQNVGLNAPLQNVQNSFTARAQANMDNLGDWGSTDITAGARDIPDSGFGAAQPVIDAWKALQQPGLDKSRDAERTRLATMGITMGSDASNDSERNLGNIQTDADNKAILAGTTEYGNVFNRGMQARNQTVNENVTQSNLMTALRGKKFGEATGAIDAVKGMQPTFASYGGATVAPAADVYGAGADTWRAAQYQYGNALGQQNANAAASAGRTSGNMGLLSAGLQGLGGVGGLASTIGGWFGSGPAQASAGGDQVGNLYNQNNGWGNSWDDWATGTGGMGD